MNNNIMKKNNNNNNNNNNTNTINTMSIHLILNIGSLLHTHTGTIQNGGDKQFAQYDFRTEKHCRQLLQTTKTMTQKEQSVFCKDNSFHPIESGLWGFCDGDTVQGSSSWAFASDSMHNEDLGVFLYIIKNMQVTGFIGH